MSSPNLKVLQERYLDTSGRTFTILSCEPHPEYKTWFFIRARRDDGKVRTILYSPRARKGKRIRFLISTEDMARCVSKQDYRSIMQMQQNSKWDYENLIYTTKAPGTEED